MSFLLIVEKNDASKNKAVKVVLGNLLKMLLSDTSLPLHLKWRDQHTGWPRFYSWPVCTVLKHFPLLSVWAASYAQLLDRCQCLSTYWPPIHWATPLHLIYPICIETSTKKCQFCTPSFHAINAARLHVNFFPKFTRCSKSGWIL